MAFDLLLNIVEQNRDGLQVSKEVENEANSVGS